MLEFRSLSISILSGICWSVVYASDGPPPFVLDPIKAIERHILEDAMTNFRVVPVSQNYLNQTNAPKYLNALDANVDGLSNIEVRNSEMRNSKGLVTINGQFSSYIRVNVDVELKQTQAECTFRSFSSNIIMRASVVFDFSTFQYYLLDLVPEHVESMIGEDELVCNGRSGKLPKDFPKNDFYQYIQHVLDMGLSEALADKIIFKPAIYVKASNFRGSPVFVFDKSKAAETLFLSVRVAITSTMKHISYSESSAYGKFH